MSKIIQIPIFPLPNAILFPGVYVPFHIFEERYKTMLQKIEAEKLELAVSYAPELQPGKFYPSMICGAGVVRVLQKNQKGESDIVVFGKKRVKFHRYIQELPYLVGEGEILEMNLEMPEKTYSELLGDIREMIINWVFSNVEDSEKAIRFFQGVKDLEALCNFVGYYFVKDIEEKQKLLEENHLEAKSQKIWQILKDLGPSDGPKLKDNLVPFPTGKKPETH
ncbi:MAG: LON peptidase substrate-binding domain-containing protein [Oligoflexia bacterium]|nr:LON peptidase substrate-binding domain-containing protein [Oligoflexia bacterium]